MATICTKFDIGQTVYHANIATESRQHPCPDCLGSRKWEAKSPAGTTFEFDCPRCSTNYMENNALSLKYAVLTPRVLALTIGSVHANTNTGSGRGDGNTYMCLETGVGSGTVYPEDDLFETAEEAHRHGEIKAALKNADAAGWVAKQYNATVKVCDYQLKDAALIAAADACRRLRFRVQYLIEDLGDEETIDGVRERIQSWRDEA